VPPKTYTKVSVSESWIRLILFVQRTLPHGELTVRIVNGEPTELVASKRRVRFDKPDTIPFDESSPDGEELET